MKIKTKRLIIFLLITFFIILVLLIVSFFAVLIVYFDYAPDYLTKIACKEQPYEDLEYYTEQEPYTIKEYYYEQEPYTDTERYCSDRSWWSGDCVSWDYRTVTKYRAVQKSREVIKYKNVIKSRTVVRIKELCIKIYLWESPNYSENWINYQELYNKQGERISIPEII